MNITDYILKEIKSLTLKSTVKKAQKLFKDYPITHFNVVENNILLGSFSESDIQTIEDKEALLADYLHLITHFFTNEKATVLELLKIFADNDCTVIPVLDANKKYIGYYDLCDVLDVFATSPFMVEESETLIVETLENDFSMSRISQIVETNGGKLLGSYISEKRSDHVQITLKIVTQEINEIIQTFRRYDYSIISSHENDVYLEDLKNRSEYLQKYLNM
jgi:predicted transcriptional regulator